MLFRKSVPNYHITIEHCIVQSVKQKGVLADAAYLLCSLRDHELDI